MNVIVLFIRLIFSCRMFYSLFKASDEIEKKTKKYFFIFILFSFCSTTQICFEEYLESIYEKNELDSSSMS